MADPTITYRAGGLATEPSNGKVGGGDGGWHPIQPDE